jgi:hypothetical protein
MEREGSMSGDGVQPPLSSFEIPLGREPKELIDRLVEVMKGKELVQADALPVLSQLAVSLSNRFEREDGDYDEAMQRAPWLAAGVRQMKEQHGQLMGILGDLQDTVRGGEAAAPWSQNVGAQINQFIDLYYEHEAAECSLLQDSCDEPPWTFD